MKHEGCNKIASHLKSDVNKNVYSLFTDCKDISEKLYTEEELGESNSLFLNKMSILKEEFGITRNLPVNSRPCSKSLNHRKSAACNSINDSMITDVSADTQYIEEVQENEIEQVKHIEHVEENKAHEEKVEENSENIAHEDKVEDNSEIEIQAEETDPFESTDNLELEKKEINEELKEEIIPSIENKEVVEKEISPTTDA